jgi:2,4-dienoyl-CoA reductase-like NADH-dependent reductase (Old Yellow Enzyme family)
MAGLFDSYMLKGVTLRNHIQVAPMCQYMAEEGAANDWHKVHYASLARGGAGLVVVEATAVSPEGRISWGDLGLWNDTQRDALKEIVAGIKAGGAVAGIQIGHAGRKASSNRPWEGDDHIPLGEPHSWETIAPSAIAFGKALPRVPHAMSIDEIKRVQQDTVCAVERARDAGFEWLQLHFAHGYLAQEFFSPLSNQRTDEYGGSAENRARFLLETFRAVRKVWPEDRPLAVRLGVIEFYGDDEAMQREAIALLKQMKSEGLDFVDVSVGFNTPEAQIPWGENFMVPVARRVLEETGLQGSTAWYLSHDAQKADALIRAGQLDLYTLARIFLSDPHWPYHAAKELGIEEAAWKTLPPPYAHWISRYR